MLAAGARGPCRTIPPSRTAESTAQASKKGNASMTDFGFWAMAQEDPGHLALVGPDGTEIKAGALLGRANQVVHGLRKLGMEPGDTIAFVLPNSVEVFEIYLAALQAGWFIVPINHHLVAPEIAYIVSDAG